MICKEYFLKKKIDTLVSRFLSRSDSVTISVWNSRKIHKRQGAGFLGCVRLNPSTISRLKDTGCK